MIIGGSYIYTEFLPLADRIYLTRVIAEVDGDAVLPELQQDEWCIDSEEHHTADESNDYATKFVVLTRTVRT